MLCHFHVTLSHKHHGVVQITRIAAVWHCAGGMPTRTPLDPGGTELLAVTALMMMMIIIMTIMMQKHQTVRSGCTMTCLPTTAKKYDHFTTRRTL